MREEAWVRGMALLVANLKAPELTGEMATLRGDTYRRKLGHLGDEAWLHAVDRALEEPGGWFPGIGDLLDYAARAPQEASRAALTDDTRSPEEKRADARRMLEVIKATVGGDAGKDMPEPETVVVASDERMAELRRQARVIGGATAVAVEEIEGRA